MGPRFWWSTRRSGQRLCTPPRGCGREPRYDQLVDDLLDLTGDPEVTGKDVSLDLMEGKLTWPIILASERCESVRKQLAKIGTEGHLLDAAAITDLSQQSFEPAL